MLGHSGFFHVDPRGEDAYPQRYRYAGDFRDGLAVVHGAEGAFHLRPDGQRLGTATYRYAEPFHTGFGVVADDRGVFHVDPEGRCLHAHRLASAEPFYNGVALCRTLDGELIRLRENGTWTRVAETVEPISMAELQAALGSGHRAGLFLRHAERYAITAETPDWGNGIPLTERGHAQAIALGSRLREATSLGFWSSPIERCCETARAIGRGAGLAAPTVETHTHLGHPGIYLDGTGHHEALMQADFHGYATGYLDNGVAPGSLAIPDASEELIAFMAEAMVPWAYTVFITHDFFSATLMSFLGLKAPDEDDWCDYLEGVCLLDGPSGLTFRRFLGVKELGPC